MEEIPHSHLAPVLPPGIIRNSSNSIPVLSFHSIRQSSLKIQNSNPLNKTQAWVALEAVFTNISTSTPLHKTRHVPKNGVLTSLEKSALSRKSCLDFASGRLAYTPLG